MSREQIIAKGIYTILNHIEDLHKRRWKAVLAKEYAWEHDQKFTAYYIQDKLDWIDEELAKAEAGIEKITPSISEEEWAEFEQEERMDARKAYPKGSTEMLDAAWGLIANAYGGDWSEAPEEWHRAARKWREAWEGVHKEAELNPLMEAAGWERVGTACAGEATKPIAPFDVKQSAWTHAEVKAYRERLQAMVPEAPLSMEDLVPNPPQSDETPTQESMDANEEEEVEEFDPNDVHF